MAKVSPTRGIITILGLSLLLWGLWVVNPFFTTFTDTVALYSVMADIASETTWGLLYITGGLLVLFGVGKKVIHWIRAGAFLGFVLWLTVSICYGLADLSATPTVTNFCLCLMHAWVYIQIRLHPETIIGNKVVPDGWQKEEDL